MSKVVVVGAGVIGLAIGRELAERGSEVVIVDMQRPGAGSSMGNAGWITPSLSNPVPEPGLIQTSLRWMLQPSSPLYIRPQADPEVIKWTWEFFKHCNEESYRHGMDALLELNRNTMGSFDRLKERGVEFYMHQAGMLFVAMEDEGLQHVVDVLAELKRLDYSEPRLLTGPDLEEFEPKLSPSLAGAVHVPEERLVRPESLVRGLVQQLRELDVRIHDGVEVTGAVKDNGAIQALETNKGHYEADTFVLAAGAWTGRVAKSFGENVPVLPGRGYSMTIEDPNYMPATSQYLVEARVAVTPFGDALRLAGTMELSGLDTKPRKSRVKAIWRNARKYFRSPIDGSRARSWAGMRPMTPDGLPVIGRAAENENLFVASGHAMLGVTLAPLTGQAVGALVHGEKPPFDLEAFDPRRFA